MSSSKNFSHSKLLQAGNLSLHEGNYIHAIQCYAQALFKMPELQHVIRFNLNYVNMLRRKYPVSDRLQVAVCGWELSHNAAGRVYTLAKIYQRFASVEIIGAIFHKYGQEVWQPIQDIDIAIHTFVVERDTKFVAQALKLVTKYPYDIVHLSKPRAANIFIGILYKVIWGAKVLMDVDDEELAFVDATEPLELHAYLQQHSELPPLQNLDDKCWTQLAVGLAKNFDGVTVSNPALQQRYGGEIIRHARDERLFIPSASLKQKSRHEFGIPSESVVVLFFGTPRRHKGLLKVAQILAKLNDPRLIFMVVGDFPDASLKSELQSVSNINCKFFGNQQFSSIPPIVAMADYCLLPMDANSMAARFQTPAKLSDALAMGIPTWVTPTDGVCDILEAGVCFVFDVDDVEKQLAAHVQQANNIQHLQEQARLYFLQVLSIQANQHILQNIIFNDKSNKSHTEYDHILNYLSKHIELI